MKMRLVLLIIVAFVGMTFGVHQDVKAKGDVWHINVITEYPHDPEAFTQGLTIHNGQMYEGTGLYGHSSLRCVDINTGKAKREVSLDKAHFGEGITVLENRIFLSVIRRKKNVLKLSTIE